MNTGKIPRSRWPAPMDFAAMPPAFTRIARPVGGDHRVRSGPEQAALHRARNHHLPQHPRPAPETLTSVTGHKHCACHRRPASRQTTHRSSITMGWSASRSGARRWQRCQRKAATGASMSMRWPSETASPRRGRCTSTKTWRLDAPWPNTVDKPWPHRARRCAAVDLSGAEWAASAPPRRRGEDAHAARPAGQHSSDLSSSRWQAARAFMALVDMLLPAASRTTYVVDRGATSTLPAFSCLTKPWAIVLRHLRGQVEHPMLDRVLFAPTDRSTGVSFATRPPSRGRLLHAVRNYPELLRRIRSSSQAWKRPRVRQDAGLHHQPSASGRHHLRALQKPLAGGTLLQVDQAASSDQAVLRHVGERGEDADLDCRLGLRPRRHRQEAPRPGRLALHFVTDPLGDPLRENAHTSSTCGRRKQMQRFANNQPIEFIRFLTGH